VGESFFFLHHLLVRGTEHAQRQRIENLENDVDGKFEQKLFPKINPEF
jgi:hypothetical protein